MKRFLREPLVHFLLLGGMLFGIGIIRGESATPESTRIAITPGVLERLMEGFRMTWRRPPTEAEFQGLVREYLKEEVLYREALVMGLDQGDEIIRRRLRQKLEFLTADFVGAIEPTDEELQAYLDQNPDRYRRDARVTFHQVFFRAGDDVARAGARAERALEGLRAAPDTDLESVGDPFLHPTYFEDFTELGLTNTFGPDFAEALLRLPEGEWSGPVESPYGLHLVYLDAIVPGRIPTLAEAREEVYRDLVSERTEEAEELYFQGLLSQYTVTVSWPEGMAPVELPGVVR
jgi:hypothetical protein